MLQRKVQWGGVMADPPPPPKKVDKPKESIEVKAARERGFPYLYPNRPILVPADPKNPMNPSRDYLDSLEKEGCWVAELKWNGDNTQVYLENSPPVFWNRKEEKLCYTPTPEVLEELARWPKGTILNCETVHRHTKTIKNKLIVHCIMAWKGQLLSGKSWGDSRKILEDNKTLFGTHVVLSEIHKTGFWDLYKQADGEIVEGIVLKNPQGKLVFSSRVIGDVSWMRKIRVKSKKYPF